MYVPMYVFLKIRINYGFYSELLMPYKSVSIPIPLGEWTKVVKQSKANRKKTKTDLTEPQTMDIRNIVYDMCAKSNYFFCAVNFTSIVFFFVLGQHITIAKLNTEIKKRGIII